MPYLVKRFNVLLFQDISTNDLHWKPGRGWTRVVK